MDMKQLREQLNLRTVDVASQVGLGESTIRNWENGRTMPKMRFDQLDKLLLLYGCTYEELRKSVQESIDKGKGLGSV